MDKSGCSPPFSIQIKQSGADWIKPFILYFGKKHWRDMGAAEVKPFLTHLAIKS